MERVDMLPMLGRASGRPISFSQLAMPMLSGLLTILAAIQLAWMVAIVVQPAEVLYSEAIVYDKAARLLRGEPLYQPLDQPPYSVTAYTPLYYWLAAGLHVAVGPGFPTGRVVSFVAGLLTAGLVAHLVVQGTADRRAGVFAALLFLALGLAGIPPWSALYREHLLGVALSLGAIASLAGGITSRRLFVAGLLAGLAILTKQTLIASALAGSVYLWGRDQRKAALFVGLVLAIVLGTSVILEITTGAYLANTIAGNVNPFSWDALVRNGTMLLLFQAGPLATAVLYLVCGRHAGRGTDRGLLGMYWAASLLPLVGLAKVGSGQNYWIELAAITAVLATLGIWDRLRPGARPGRPGIPILLLAVTLAAVTPIVVTAALGGLAVIRSGPSHVGQISSVIERVKSEPAEVLAEPLDVVVLAGRPILLEPYIFSILHRQGRWDADPLARRICAGDVGLLVLEQPLEADDLGLHGYPHWPVPILMALRDTMRLESEQAGRLLYVPRQDLPAPRCGSDVRDGAERYLR
jgi:hypothetical protein